MPSGPSSRRSRAARTCPSRFRTSPPVPRSPRSRARRQTSPGWPTGAWKSFRPRMPSSPTRRSPTSSGRSSPRGRRPILRRSKAPCASSRRQGRAPRWSSSPTRCSGSCATARRRRRSGSSPRHSTACVRPSRRRSPTAGVPYAFEGRVRLGQIPFGHALLSALRFLWQGEGRRDLFGFLRSPYSGLPRAHADYLEGRLRGNGVRTDIEERTVRVPRPAAPPASTTSAPRPRRRTRSACWRRGCCGAPTGSSPRPATEASRVDLRAYEQVLRLLKELDGWRDLAGTLAREDVLAALERVPVRLAGGRGAGPGGRLDLLRARTRRFEAMFVLGLEEGNLPAARDRVAVPRRRRAARPRRAARARASSGPTPSPGSGSSSTRRARARRGGSDARARGGDGRRRAATGEPVLGRGARRSSTRPTWRAGRDGARSRRSRGRSTTRRPSASACARSRRWPRTMRSGAEALALANGWERRLQRARERVRPADRAVEPGRPGRPGQAHDAST